MLTQPYITFLSLTQTLSYTQTAQHLFITQPQFLSKFNV